MKKEEKNQEKTEDAEIDHEQCPVCGEKALVLLEHDAEVPYFGKIAMFSMTCSSCKYHKADIEALERKDPSKFEFEISCEDDMKVRVVKSSEATVKLPHIMTMTPGPASQGFVTNVEGILNRAKYMVESAKEMEEDESEKKKAKNMLKKIINIQWGREKQKLIIEDPSGNSAIISDKAIKTVLKVKKQE